MVRIVHIIKDWGSQGVPSYHVELIPLLLKKGYENFVIIRNNEVSPTKELESKTIQADGITIFKKLFELKPDILIIFHHFGSPITIFLQIVSKILHIKTIIVTDFTDTGLPRIHKSPLKTIRDILRYILFSSQLFLVDAPVCFTDYEKNVLSKMASAETFRIIPIGNNFEIQTSRKENYILTVSRWWSDRKNLHTSLRVFSSVIKNKECKFVIVGNFHSGAYYISDEARWETGEEYKQKIMKLIKDLDLEKHVEFKGVKMGRELQELYRKAKILYLPSKNETFGMTYVEAMSSGTPVVAMGNSAVQYVVRDGVTGFLRNTEEDQKEAILKLLTDEMLYKQMEINCLKEAEKYRWENVVKQWEYLINGLALER